MGLCNSPDIFQEKISELMLGLEFVRACKNAVKYLGYWITCRGIQPLPKKVKALKNLLPPTTKHKLHHFIGLINYHHDMWTKQLLMFAPLASLTSKTTTWGWES